MGGLSGGPLRRGQIWWAWLDPVVGSEQARRRPVVIVCADDLLVGPTVIAVPLTSTASDPMPAFKVPLAADGAGLTRDSFALCQQVRVLSLKRLGRLVGQVAPDDMRAIDRALLYALGLEDAA